MKCENNDCPYNSHKPCQASEGCAGYERKEYCSTCIWYAEFEGVCCNSDSEYVADFRCLDDCCEKWEGVSKEEME